MLLILFDFIVFDLKKNLYSQIWAFRLKLKQQMLRYVVPETPKLLLHASHVALPT